MNLFIRFAVATTLLVFADFAHGQTTRQTSTGDSAIEAAVDWPPTVDPKFTTTRSVDGRAIEHYTHGERKSWGYPASEAGHWGYHAGQESGPGGQNHNTFYLVAPKTGRDNAPLCVVLHSANRTGFDYLGYASLNRKVDPTDDPPTATTSSPDDFYALYLNSTNDEWWGWNQARQSSNFATNINAPAPAELRVLDTIEWILTKCNIDRNRIYLCGVSMGGCGSLGIGMPHGDIFAAVRVVVPAGTEYAGYRMGGFTSPPADNTPENERAHWLKAASGFGIPDPPVIVNFSATNDSWSATQPALLAAALNGRLPLILGWGPFGHTGSSRPIGQFSFCDVALAFPWLQIRRNEAYPVFTRTSCDQRAPWSNSPAKADESGQINAWFRWKSERDTPSEFAMEIWIEHPKIGNPPAGIPESATSDITLRRLQQFKITPSTTYAWRLSRGESAIASGAASPDAANLLTVPAASLTTEPVELSIKATAR